jgi:hypothetical protein
MTLSPSGQNFLGAAVGFRYCEILCRPNQPKQKSLRVLIKTQFCAYMMYIGNRKNLYNR